MKALLIGILMVFLGAPGVTPHVEFVLARFIETDKAVYAAIYSHKIPLKSKKKNQNINVDEIIRNKDAWIKELFDLTSQRTHRRVMFLANVRHERQPTVGEACRWMSDRWRG